MKICPDSGGGCSELRRGKKENKVVGKDARPIGARLWIAEPRRAFSQVQLHRRWLRRQPLPSH
eukprot:5935301-Pleurochrysis_carterae.AAC.1